MNKLSLSTYVGVCSYSDYVCIIILCFGLRINTLKDSLAFSNFSNLKAFINFENDQQHLVKGYELSNGKTALEVTHINCLLVRTCSGYN